MGTAAELTVGNGGAGPGSGRLTATRWPGRCPSQRSVAETGTAWSSAVSHAGEIWFDNRSGDGMPPDPVVDDDRELTFRAWYACWLDECEQRWLKWPDHILRDSCQITSLVWG